MDRFKQEPMYELPTGRKEKSLFSKEVSPLFLLKNGKILSCVFLVFFIEKNAFYTREKSKPMD